MNNAVITSRDNDRVRHARKVREGKVPSEIFVEGVRLCEQVVGSKLRIVDVLHTPQVEDDERVRHVIEALSKGVASPAMVSERVFESVSDTKSPQGIAVLAERPITDESGFGLSLEDVPMLVILHKINNPANAGAILRAAEGAGATGVIATEGTTDLFSSKALRGAMGSTFRLPIWMRAGFSAVVEWCKAHHIRVTCADARAEHIYTAFDWTIPCGLLVGPEADGLTADEIAMVGESLRIPMRHPVESLNVAVATAIILYEAVRQRNG